MERRIEIVESALARFTSRCGAEPETKVKIKAALTQLKSEPLLGFPLPFTNPLFFQLPVDNYRIHYRVEDFVIRVLYIGIYGVC